MGYDTGLYGEFSITPPAPSTLRDLVNHWAESKDDERTSYLPDDAPSTEYESPFTISEDGAYLNAPDDIGRYYSYEDWLPYIADLLMAGGHKIEGEITWDGDNPDDKGRFVATGSQVHTETLASYYVPDGNPSPLRVLLDEAEATVASFERLLAAGHAEGDPARAVFVQRINDLAAAVREARGILRGEEVSA